MLVLITYDVNTTDSEGAKRLRHVAKACANKGARVQYSVFECLLDNAEYLQLKYELEKIIDLSKDSLRFYKLGDKYKSKIETVGKSNVYDPQDVLMI